MEAAALEVRAAIVTSAGHTQPLLCLRVALNADAKQSVGGQDATVVLLQHTMLCVRLAFAGCKAITQLRQLGPSAPGGMLSMEPPEETQCRLPAAQSPHKHALHLTFTTAIVDAASGLLQVGPAIRVLRRRPVLHIAVAAGAVGQAASLACSRGCGFVTGAAAGTVVAMLPCFAGGGCEMLLAM